jgi:hypothetical protein
MSGWVGVDNPEAARLLLWSSEDDGTKVDSPETGGTEIRNGQVEMKLLRRATWPFWRGVWRCPLEGQLEGRISEVHLTPLWIAHIRLPMQEACVKGRESWRVGAIEDDGAQTDES